MSVDISKLNVSFYVYETESLAKNIAIVKRFIGTEIIQNSEINVELLEGAYGNKIAFVELSISNKNYIKKVVNQLVSSLSEKEKELLFNEFDTRFDHNKKVFYIRLDKSMGYKERRLKITYSSYSIKFAIKMISFKPKADFKKSLCDIGLLKRTKNSGAL